MAEEFDSSDVCILCKKLLREGDVVTVSRGLSALVASSQRRHDDISSLLQGLSTITVHVECRKRYTRGSSIKAVINSPPKQLISSKVLRSKESVFIFKQHCIFLRR